MKGRNYGQRFEGFSIHGIMLLALFVTVLPRFAYSDSDNLMKNPQFSEINHQTNEPKEWKLWNGEGDDPKNRFEIDSTTYTILPSHTRNCLKYISFQTNPKLTMYQENIGVTPGGTYEFSMVHRESKGFNHRLYVYYKVYTQKNGARYDTLHGVVDSNIPYSDEWKSYRGKFTIDTLPEGETLDVFRLVIFPRGKGEASFSEVTLDTLDEVPSECLQVKAKIGYRQKAKQLRKWKVDTLEGAMSDQRYSLHVTAGEIYGSISPKKPISLNIEKFPYLNVQIQQYSDEGGFGVVIEKVDGQDILHPLGLMPYTEVSGVITYNLKEELKDVLELKGKVKIGMSFYVVGEGKEIDISWVRCANKPLPQRLEIERNKKIVLFTTPIFSVNDYTTLPEEAFRPVEVTMCPNEIASASFCLYARKHLKKIRFEISDLKSTAARIIPSDSIDIHAVKVWYQAGTKSKKEPTNTVLVPELLLKNDALITVDRNCDTNSVLFTQLPVDSATLQPVEIEANSTKEFWLTIKTPEDTPPGIYEGEIRIKPKKHKSKLSIAVEVLPFKLKEPGKTCSMWGVYSSESEIKDLSEHGLNTLAIYLYHSSYRVIELEKEQGNGKVIDVDVAKLKDVIDTMLKYGMDSPVILVPAWLPLRGGGPYVSSWTTEKKEDFQTVLQKLKELQTETGYPEFWIFGQDEMFIKANAESTMERTKEGFRLIKAAGFKTANSIYNLDKMLALDTDKEFDALLDYPIYIYKRVDEIMTSDRKLRTEGLYYFHPYEDPIYQRFTFGLYCWYSKMGGFAPWMYKAGNSIAAYDDWAEEHKTLRFPGYVYPAVNADNEKTSISTIQWEAARAGINDLRYLNSLRVLVEQAGEMQNSNEIEDLIDEVNTFLEETPAFMQGRDILELEGVVEPEQFLDFRQSIIGYILSLKDFLEQQ